MVIRCACVLIKPHAFKSAQGGAIIEHVSAAFTINALELFSLDRANASEFFEVYRVCPRFPVEMLA